MPAKAQPGWKGSISGKQPYSCERVGLTDPAGTVGSAGPLIESGLSDYSHEFLPGRQAHEAVKAAGGHVHSGKHSRFDGYVKDLSQTFEGCWPKGLMHLGASVVEHFFAALAYEGLEADDITVAPEFETECLAGVNR